MSNIEFYTKTDIKDILLKNNNGLKITNEQALSFLDQTNNNYEALCNTKGVYDDDIIINDKSTVKDERNPAMVLLCQYFFRQLAFYSLSNAKDDIYWIKGEKAEKSYMLQLPLLSYDKIIGELPPVVSKASSSICIPLSRS